MITIISIANQKGGVGKTTTAVTLGHGLALRGLSVLLIDTDPQGHVAVSLGQSKSPGLYYWLVDEEPLSRVVFVARENLHIIPSDKRTEKAIRYIASLDYREHQIDYRLEAAHDYDVTLIDLAPSLNVLHVAALAASDFVLIPARLDHLALDGVNEVLRSIAEITHQGGKIQDYAILPTFFDRVTTETLAQYQALLNVLSHKIWPPIPTDTHVREACAHGQTLWEYCPLSRAITGYPNGDGGKHQGGYLHAVTLLMDLLNAR
jgi:chromosome partitioning protein